MLEGITTNTPSVAGDHSVLEIDFRCHPVELPPTLSFSYETENFMKMTKIMFLD